MANWFLLALHDHAANITGISQKQKSIICSNITVYVRASSTYDSKVAICDITHNHRPVDDKHARPIRDPLKKKRSINHQTIPHYFFSFFLFQHVMEMRGRLPVAVLAMAAGVCAERMCVLLLLCCVQVNDENAPPRH